jgi:hypothetical protein
MGEKTANAAIRIRALRKRYGRRVALDNVSSST